MRSAHHPIQSKHFHTDRGWASSLTGGVRGLGDVSAKCFVVFCVMGNIVDKLEMKMKDALYMDKGETVKVYPVLFIHNITNVPLA